MSLPVGLLTMVLKPRVGRCDRRHLGFLEPEGGAKYNQKQNKTFSGDKNKPSQKNGFKF